jgi:hypothetical protein
MSAGPTADPALPSPLATVVLPAFDEEEALPVVLADLAEHLGPEYEIIVVDDGSTDGTSAAAERAGVKVIRHPVNLGKGAAMATGAEAARGDLLVFVDADATYPPEAIPTLVAMLDHHDLVRAERPLDSPHIPAVNRFGNRLFNRLLGSFHRLEGRDFLSGLYGMRKQAFEQLRLESSGFDIEVEIGVKARRQGLDLGTFDIDYHPRLGEKKLRPFRDGLRILVRAAGIAVLASPTVTFLVPGLVLMALGLAGAAALWAGPRFVGSVGLSVNTFVIAVLGVVAGFQLVILGIAATLYRIESGVVPPRWVLRLADRPIRLGAAVSGLILAIVGTVRLLALAIGWLSAGAGPFLDTAGLVTSASVAVFGLQLLSGGLFLSIFAGRLAARRD